MTQINKLMIEFFNIQKEIKDLEAKKDRIKAEVKLYMTNTESDRYIFNGHLVSYKNQVRKSLDKELLLSYIDQSTMNKCYKESSFMVLRILSKESLEKMKSFIKD